MKPHHSSIAFLAATLASGCTMGPTVNLTIDEPRPASVQAWGYPAKKAPASDSLYNSLSIRLQSVRPFVFVFPDGFRAPSNAITEAMLSTHVGPIQADSYGRRLASYLSANGNGEYRMVFDLGKDGLASSVWLYSCNHVAPEVLATADGRARFGFPMRQKEIEMLFPGRPRIGHDFVLLGWECL